MAMAKEKATGDDMQVSELRGLLLTLVVVAALLVGQPAAAAGVIMFVGDTLFDYDRDLEINLIEPSGKAHRRVVPRYPMRDASINPLGELIAYSRRDNSELRVIGIDGRKDRLLAKVNGKDLDTMSWSPNGRYIAYGYKQPNFLGVRGHDVVSIIDTKRKRVLMNYRVSRNLIIPSAAVGTFDTITSIDWSPNSRYLAVVEKIATVGFGTISYAHKTYIIDTRTNKIKNKGDYPSFGFLNNNQVLVKLASGDIGVINRANNRTKSLVNLGPPANVTSIVRKPGGKQLLVTIVNAKESFDQGLTGLAELRAGEGNERLGYDFMKVDLSTKAATLITPTLDSFLENKAEDRQMEWRRRTSQRTFRSHSCWGWVITMMGTNRNDRIIGTQFADVIHARGGNDYVNGRGGNDVICGGAGDDRLVGHNGNDLLLGDIARNRYDYHEVFPGRDKLFGSNGVDSLFGEHGNDVLRGGNGDDFLSGQPGDDKLIGKPGDRDYLQGGDGTDECIDFHTSDGCE